MIIPCIDLLGGKVVQLIQGKEKALERTLQEALEMCSGFPLLHIIDLDAAIGSGTNMAEVDFLLNRVRARVGGGVKTLNRAKQLIDSGTEQVIIGSAAYLGSEVNHAFLHELVREIGISRIMIAIDSKGGKIAIDGWKNVLTETPGHIMEALAPYCSGYLCTNVDQEGLLQGTNLDLFLGLRSKTEKTLVAAGGITTMTEVETLTVAGVEVALGMAIYTGRLDMDLLRTQNS